MSDTYVCACCSGTFCYGDRDRAEAEAVRNKVDPADSVTVCHACFETIRDLSDGAILAGPALN